MNTRKRKIYLLENLPPEVKAVTFAKCSRSPKSFRIIANELTEEKSAEFHEKWVVGYGHSSVAEHAVLSIAFENVSILASKVIEDNRLASYTEKSTRYQDFSKQVELPFPEKTLTPYRYYCPQKIIQSEFKDLYLETLDNLFIVYDELKGRLAEYLKERFPRESSISEKLYEAKIRSRVFDNIRYLLPTATLTNLGMTVNARSLEHAIRKMLTHPLDEVKEIGQEVKEVALQSVPTLVKYADYNEYLGETSKALEKLAQDILPPLKTRDTEPVVLVDYNKDAENKLVAVLLYHFSNNSYQQIKQSVDKMSQKDKEKVINEALKRMQEHDWPIRELEHVYYTFDILVDYGAFRDIQRHRICTQTNQDLTPNYGYAVPEDITEAGLEDRFTMAAEKALETYNKIAEKFPKEAQYILPLAFRKRVLFTWNLRELHHFIKLRSGKKGHPSYRRIAQQIWREINRVHPLLARYIRVDLS